MTPTRNAELLTVDEVAAELKINRKTLLNWRALGMGPVGFRVGRGVRYSREAVDQYLDNCRRNDPLGAA